MADDFPKTLFKTAGVPKTLFFFSQNMLILPEPRGSIIICILFMDLERFAIQTCSCVCGPRATPCINCASMKSIPAFLYPNIKLGPKSVLIKVVF